MKTFFKILGDLEKELETIRDVSPNPLEQAECAIGHCKIAMDALRESVIHKKFPDQKSEILFFKKIKPSVCSKLFYYQEIFKIESSRPQYDKDTLKSYFQDQLAEKQGFLTNHLELVQYYRRGHTYLDEQYFTRKNNQIPLGILDSQSLIDEEFCSWQEPTFSSIIAHEMVIDYLKNQQATLSDTETDKFKETKLEWTDSKIFLHELIYAFYYSGSVNDGKATIKDLAEAFEKIFNVDLQKDIYRAQHDLFQRAEPAKFLNRLAAILEKKSTSKLK